MPDPTVTPVSATPVSPVLRALRMPPAGGDDALLASARALEAAFLSEMLKGAGFGAPRDSFGGGAGEEQFSSMLRDMQAQALAEAGGIGLAGSIFAALKRDAAG